MLIHTGNRGSQVTQLQKELKAAGCSPGAIDGDFGGHTLRGGDGRTSASTTSRRTAWWARRPGTR